MLSWCQCIQWPNSEASAAYRSRCPCHELDKAVDGPWLTHSLTVGLYGPWGQGKSTIMNLLRLHMLLYAASLPCGEEKSAYEERLARVTDVINHWQAGKDTPSMPHAESCLQQLQQLASRQIVDVWFNAWQFTTDIDAWAGLMVTISRRMEEQLTWWQALLVSWRFHSVKQKRDMVVNLWVPALMAIALAAIITGLGWTALASIQPSLPVKNLRIGLPVITCFLAFIFICRQVRNVRLGHSATKCKCPMCMSASAYVHSCHVLLRTVKMFIIVPCQALPFR